MAALGLAYTAHHERLAYADDEDDEEEDGGGGEKAGGGGEEEEEEGEGEGDEDKDQPPVTAGGLFTMKSYPVREISRPLTMTVGVAQVRAALGTDLSAKGAFKTGGISLEGIFGQTDNFNLIGGFTNAYNMRQFGAYFGFEGALAYDIVDIRVAANIHRNALPQFSSFCTPVSSADMVDQNSPLPSQCGAAGAAIVNLPNGAYNAGDIKFGVDLGFPFRYAIKPEVAIVALQTLMTIDFNGVAKDHVITEKMEVMDPSTGMMVTQVKNVPVGNKATPDLNPSVGIATNPIPPLSVVIFAQLRIPDFDTAAGAFQVPVTGRVEFSPNQKFDLGLEFTLLNVKPPEGQSPIDNRFLSLFVQSRFGK